jgi:hypothetical protein
MENLPAFRENKVVALARELAMDINEMDDILKMYQISEDEFEQLKADPAFQTVFDATLVEWQAATNTEKRVKVKAASSVENSLLNLHAAANDKNQPLNHRVLALQFISKMAGLAEPETKGPTGNGFSITINMGEGHTKTIEATAITQINAEVNAA